VHGDLLDQAKMLATLDKGKPRQANLRRAVSAAYYALFHYLVAQSCRAIIGTQHAQRGYRHALSRAFLHTTMKNACRSFSSCQLPAAVAKPLPGAVGGAVVVANEIKAIAATFCELQQKRVMADYDLAERFRRSEVLTLVKQVADEIGKFESASATDERQFFLACLLAWKELGNR